ncbi:uncharacterized protein LOC143483166 isoform X1 [Brachyhypopomus gauderio]|uniref:uncharacterized protein LOC143483166 isoform X1 n=1 Tax=Brachyhypopomus gauderio TaxID=698409 RepID=UPI00404224D3
MCCYSFMDSIVLFVSLLCISDSECMRTLKHVAVKSGDSVTIPCFYDESYKSNNKYWCHGYYWSSCTIVTYANTNGSTSVIDHPTHNMFTVELNKLNTNHSGWYWCVAGIGDQFKPDDKDHLYLTVSAGKKKRVKEAALPDSQSEPEAALPDFQSEPEVVLPDSQSEPEAALPDSQSEPEAALPDSQSVPECPLPDSHLSRSVRCLTPSLSRSVRCLTPSLSQSVRCLTPSLSRSVRCLTSSLSRSVRCLTSSLSRSVRGRVSSLSRSVRGRVPSLSRSVRGQVPSLSRRPFCLTLRWSRFLFIQLTKSLYAVLLLQIRPQKSLLEVSFLFLNF